MSLKLLKNNCAICLETPKQTDKVRTLVCGHQFHSSCISEWIRFSKSTDSTYTCPICRYIHIYYPLRTKVKKNVVMFYEFNASDN